MNNTRRFANDCAMSIPILALTFTCFTANAADLHVPADHATIQSAIDAAQSGDEIIVGPGTYNEAIDLLGKAITIRSVDGADVTILDGNGLNSSVVAITNNETLDTVIDGLTIRNGTGSFVFGEGLVGGGVRMSDSAATFHNCIIEFNTADWGGGVWLVNSQVEFYDCIIRENFADLPGGGIFLEFSTLLLQSCEITANTSWEGGGGVHSGASTVTADNSTFRLNQTSAIHTSNTDVTVTNCRFETNAACQGGAVRVFTGTALISDSDFIGNSGACHGGAIHAAFSSPLIINCNFRENSAADLPFIGNGGAIAADIESAPIIVGCTFEKNKSTFEGGAIWIHETAQPVISDSTFCENTPDDIFGRWNDDGGNAFLSSCTCDVADLNCDGVVDVFDLIELINQWGPCDDCTPGGCPADLTGDCVVDVFDLIELINNWG